AERLPARAVRLTIGTDTVRSSHAASFTSCTGAVTSIPSGVTTVSDAWRTTPARFLTRMRSVPALDRGSAFSSDTAILAGGELPTVTSPRWIAWNGYWLVSV